MWVLWSFRHKFWLRKLKTSFNISTYNDMVMVHMINGPRRFKYFLISGDLFQHMDHLKFKWWLITNRFCSRSATFWLFLLADKILKSRCHNSRLQRSKVVFSSGATFGENSLFSFIDRTIDFCIKNYHCCCWNVKRTLTVMNWRTSMATLVHTVTINIISQVKNRLFYSKYLIFYFDLLDSIIEFRNFGSSLKWTVLGQSGRSCIEL